MTSLTAHGSVPSDARLLAAQPRVHMEDAPASVRLAAGLLLGAWSRSADRETFTGWAIRRLVAVLQVDGFAGPALTGARGGPSARQLVYTTDAADIMISIRPDSESTWFLDGIVLPGGDQDAIFEVRLDRMDAAGGAIGDLNEADTATDRTDDQGGFRFAGVRTGRCQLAVWDRDCVISVGPFDLGEPGQ